MDIETKLNRRINNNISIVEKLWSYCGKMRKEVSVINLSHCTSISLKVTRKTRWNFVLCFLVVFRHVYTKKSFKWMIREKIQKIIIRYNTYISISLFIFLFILEKLSFKFAAKIAKVLSTRFSQIYWLLWGLSLGIFFTRTYMYECLFS